jgi:hypothetical protein
MTVLDALLLKELELDLIDCDIINMDVVEFWQLFIEMKVRLKREGRSK